ncbi:hypothetical protein BD310DRAFT_971227 [Dichomitus squalens]|uniref:Uncharacterized protein n=1 Tax=Dichomitus squalens TaxID=114155 RepID=A0A4Q9PEK2_9APHY|nr:hypothetical protein BD310DRAFT_971227 [Dichomitus squalens]
MAEMFWAILPADMADMAIAMVGRNWQICKRLVERHRVWKCPREYLKTFAGHTFTKEQGLLYEYPGIRSLREPSLRPFLRGPRKNLVIGRNAAVKLSMVTTKGRLIENCTRVIEHFVEYRLHRHPILDQSSSKASRENMVGASRDRERSEQNIDAGTLEFKLRMLPSLVNPKEIGCVREMGSVAGLPQDFVTRRATAQRARGLK